MKNLKGVEIIEISIYKKFLMSRDPEDIRFVASVYGEDQNYKLIFRKEIIRKDFNKVADIARKWKDLYEKKGFKVRLGSGLVL